MWLCMTFRLQIWNLTNPDCNLNYNRYEAAAAPACAKLLLEQVTALARQIYRVNFEPEKGWQKECMVYIISSALQSLIKHRVFLHSNLIYALMYGIGKDKKGSYDGIAYLNPNKNHCIWADTRANMPNKQKDSIRELAEKQKRYVYYPLVNFLTVSWSGWKIKRLFVLFSWSMLTWC